jgi:hypothetical protein
LIRIKKLKKICPAEADGIVNRAAAEAVNTCTLLDASPSDSWQDGQDDGPVFPDPPYVHSFFILRVTDSAIIKGVVRNCTAPLF